mgnify:CR=1 FL=1|jgi:hypothetical protein
MVSSWGLFRPFPNQESGGHIEAPIGPGVYEVRHAETGELIAFGPAASVAQALSQLLPRPASGLRALFARKPLAHRSGDLEYRTCSASSAGEAKSAAERLLGRREAFWRRRLAAG